MRFLKLHDVSGRRVPYTPLSLLSSLLVLVLVLVLVSFWLWLCGGCFVFVFVLVIGILVERI